MAVSSSQLWLITIAIFVSLSGLLNFMHARYVGGYLSAASARFLDQFVTQSLAGIGKEPELEANDVISSDAAAALTSTKHRIAGLSCERFGGPDQSFAEREMVYWSDIPSDHLYHSPFRRANNEEKFLTFEPDHGGWNNIRMSYETIVVLAHAMGRTLVLPPEQKMYLLRDVTGKKREFSFKDFFHLDSFGDEHEGIDIITMEEFLTKQGMTNQLHDPDTNTPLPPPNTQVNWDGTRNQHELWHYLRKVGHVRNWDPWKCLAAFPATADPKGIDSLHDMIAEMTKDESTIPDPLDFTGKPFPVDAPAIDRLRENLGGAGRKELCIYDTEMQAQKLVHFKVDGSDDSRLLTHFYAFLFFEDWHQDLFYKRLVRDKLRYLDDLMCAAGRVIQAIRKRAQEKDPGSNGEYDSFHIRRGDFQYKGTRVDAPTIYKNSKDQLTEGATVFIATDERDKTFFQPLAEHYDIVFLDDFKELFEDLSSNYYGMLDQLVASRGRVFIGTWFSTFSGYINRLRGYYSVKQKLEGYKQGIIKSWYFIPLDKKFEMQEYRAVRKPIYMREFPTAWRDIDEGIEELHID